MVHHFTQIDGERMETVTDFIFLGSKITADHDWSHEIKRSLFLQRKAMAKLGGILKSRDITLPTKAHIVSYGFSSSQVWMWELDHNEDRVPKNWCFWTVVLEKTFQGPLDSKDIKSVNLKVNQSCIHWKDWCWSSNTLATWWEEPTHWKRSWCWERVKAEEVGDIDWDCWMASLTQWTWIWANCGAEWRTGKPGMLQSMRSQRVRHEWATEQ